MRHVSDVRVTGGTRHGIEGAGVPVVEPLPGVQVSGGTRHAIDGGGTPAVAQIVGADVRVTGGIRHGIDAGGTPAVLPLSGSDVRVTGGVRHGIEGSGTPAVAQEVRVAGGTRHGIEGAGVPAVTQIAGSNVRVTGGTRHAIDGAGVPVLTSIAGADVRVSGGIRHGIDGAGTPAVGPRPAASAPAVTIAPQADIGIGQTASLSASVSGGTYDALAYAWSDGGAGGSFSAQAAATIYTPPSVSADTAVTVTCEVTATGTGTNALSGTSDTSSDTETFVVRATAPLPPATSPRMLVPLITLGSGADIARLAGHPTAITVGGDVYEGGKAVGISPIEETEGTPDNRASVSLALVSAADLARYGVDPGPIPIEIGFAQSGDAGATWTKLTKRHAGRASLPNLEGRELSIEIETLRGDVDRGGELVWSDESQQAEFPGDRGMEYNRAIAAGDVEVAWPP